MIVNTLKCIKNLKLRTNNLSQMKNFSQRSQLTAFNSLSTFKKFNFSTEQPSGVDDGSHDDFLSKKKVGGADGNNLTDEQALEMIKKWISGNKVCLFMKGDPKEPRCGFSNFVVQTLKFYRQANNEIKNTISQAIVNDIANIKLYFQYNQKEIKDYKSIDILKYEVIRKQVKVYSNWPTFPQLYVDGKLIGGSDIVSEMHKDGSLKELFLKANVIEQ